MKNKTTIKRTTNWLSYYDHDGDLCEVVNLKGQNIETERGYFCIGWFGINKRTKRTIYFYSANQLRNFIDVINDQAEFIPEDIEASVRRYIGTENEHIRAEMITI